MIESKPPNNDTRIMIDSEGRRHWVIIPTMVQSLLELPEAVLTVVTRPDLKDPLIHPSSSDSADKKFTS